MSEQDGKALVDAEAERNTAETNKKTRPDPEEREQLEEHVTNPANDLLKIEAMDYLKAGAHHHYSITGFDMSKNPATNEAGKPWAFQTLPIIFQNGPIAEVGVNGITHEALLAILLNRIRGFQNGPYACQENEDVLTHLEEALDAMKLRTVRRMDRNVEGTSAV